MRRHMNAERCEIKKRAVFLAIRKLRLIYTGHSYLHGYAEIKPERFPTCSGLRLLLMITLADTMIYHIHQIFAFACSANRE